MRDRHDAVYVRIGIERAGRGEMLCHALAEGRGAVNRTDHANVVARGNAAVGAHKALERQRLRGVTDRLHVAAEGVVAIERADRHVVRMDAIALRDGLRGEADDLQ